MEQRVETSTGSTASQGSAARSIALDRIFPGEGEMARLMRSMDWSRTPLGPVESWPQPLRTAVSLCLSSLSPIVLWWGPELSVFYNDVYRPSLGVSKHPALGKPGREVWPEVWPTIGPLLDKVVAHGESTWAEDQLLPLDRYGFLEEVYFSYSYTPIRVESGAIGGVFCVATETTNKVLAERRMRAARDLASALVETRTAEEVHVRALHALMSDPRDVPFALLYTLDEKGANAHLAASAGLPEQSPFAPVTVSLDPGPVAPGMIDAGSAFRWPLSVVARTGQREVITGLPSWPGKETLSSDASANTLPLRAVLLPIIEPGQAAPSAILVAGVNPLRDWDEDYGGFYQLLASHLASALASAHAYEEERKRAEALAEIDRAKTSFFSNISHEFRTPLTLMLAPIADSLADAREPMPPRQRDRIELAQRNGVRLLKLVNTLLDFSRIEAGRVQASYQPTDLATFTAELASTFRSLVERAGLALVVECPPLDSLLAPTYVDREMWEKIVLNLLSNAFKYTLEGTITVSLRPMADGEAVVLEVRDTGVGIPADELPRLFERFHRVEGARARTHEGSGIGLALVQELAHLHGGAIWVESVEGEGTRLFVRIPTGAAHLPADHIQTTSTLASTPLSADSFVLEAERWLPDDLSAPSGIGASVIETPELPSPVKSDGRVARIVLADDNADMRDYLRRLLSEQYEVEAVGNGQAALDVIQRQPPDLVLTDIMMPELNGLQLLAALRANPSTRAIPVILLSARAGVEATAEGLRAGADDYLVKPFSTREILSRVAARLEMSRLRNEAEARARELELVFDAIADAAFVYDLEGRVVRMNGAARTLFRIDGVTACADRSLEERARLISEQDERGSPIPVEESGLYRLFRGESLAGPDALDVQLRLSDGALREMNITGAPLVDASGKITGAVAVSRDVTERRRLEREVRLQASMLERAHDAIFLWEPGGAITYWNRGAELLYGFTRDEAIGKVSHNLLKTVRPIPSREFEAMLDHAGEWTGELVHTTRDGRQVTVLSRQQVLHDPDGRRYVLETSRDITDRLALERAVRESEARLRAILDLLPVGVAIVDASGKPTLVNRQALAIWGKRAPLVKQVSEYGKHTALRTETGNPVEAHAWGLGRALATGEISIGVEHDIETLEGQRKTILNSDAPLRDESGAIVGAMSVTMDITERKRLERRTRDALDALLELAAVIVGGPAQSREIPEDVISGSMQSVDHVLQGFAALCSRVLGCERIAFVAVEPKTEILRVIAMIGSSAAQRRLFQASLSSLRLTDRFGPEVAARLAAGEPALIDVEQLPPGDPARVLSQERFLVAPMVAGGALYGYIGVNFGNEVAAYTAENRALARVVGKLVGTVMERVRLTQERARAEAREATLTETNRQMNEFLGIASHELRTPLTSITANVQMAERILRLMVPGDAASDPDFSDVDRLERAHTLLARTDRQVKRLDRLVGDLLDVSRIQAGKLELRAMPCDLLSIVREAVEEQRSAWPNRTISLELPRRANLPTIADGDRIGQVVTNYLTNALKYSAIECPVDVRVRMQRGVARVETRDQGPGISAEQQRRLFERFYRAPGIQQQSGSGVGLGLGLHICKTIVERHGGEVGVHSAPGKGSTFWFTVPLDGADEEAFDAMDGECDGE